MLSSERTLKPLELSNIRCIQFMQMKYEAKNGVLLTPGLYKITKYLLVTSKVFFPMLYYFFHVNFQNTFYQAIIEL